MCALDRGDKSIQMRVLEGLAECDHEEGWGVKPKGRCPEAKSLGEELESRTEEENRTKREENGQVWIGYSSEQPAEKSSTVTTDVNSIMALDT